MLAFVREIIVDRGDEPRPPRELLALTPPKAAATAGEGSPADASSGSESS